ncbi:unnamed protein product [Paramecium primaurelia]|uniref:Uncharacterized protein n=1 Tax=Paramecium primaurelia TaxID=5886 RepID=A0A8S1KCI4_PARPR|nr:unnamed protein product [Paramecium primaurelia]CAD8052311.1 unnamed protein product [Paramecium primaurelia]
MIKSTLFFLILIPQSRSYISINQYLKISEIKWELQIQYNFYMNSRLFKKLHILQCFLLLQMDIMINIEQLIIKLKIL